MSKATKFYLPFFKTGYPNGKLCTYISGTYTPAATYSDVSGTLHTNPVIMDEKGDCVLYIDSDITYRYRLQDENGNVIYEMDNIKQLNGDPGTPGGGQGIQGKPGKQGVQGKSGSQGLIGLDGLQGEKGLAYLTSLSISTNQIVTIPVGIDAIYLTGSGGGGAGASWSTYAFIYAKLNTTLTPDVVPVTYSLNGTTSAGTSLNNGASYSYKNFCGLIFIPGSGFAGQSVYRKKIALDKTKENKVQIFLGTGGVANFNNKLDGGDGQSTFIYVNDILIFELKGGDGGKQFFPKDNASIPVLPQDGTPIRLNQGAANGLIYCQNNSNNSITYPANGRVNFQWKTRYRKNNGSGGFTLTDVYLSYYAPMITNSSSGTITKKYVTSGLDYCRGSSGVFGNFYNYLQRLDDNVVGTGGGNPYFTTAIKQGNRLQGWGAGGDVFFNPKGSQASSNNGNIMNTQINADTGSGGDLFSLFNATEIKNAVIKYQNEFRLSDSYSPGVETTTPLNDATYWVGINNIEATINSSTSYVKYNGSGFYNYKSIYNNLAANALTAVGGSGVQGFVLLEFGSITEHTV